MSDQTATLDDLRAAFADSTDRQDWPALLHHAERGLQAFPDAWEPAYNQARALMESGAYERADHALLLGMDRFPTLPQFAVLYGHVGARRLTVEDALERWRAMHARMPDAPGLAVGLAHGWRAAARPDEAGRVIDAALQRWPNNMPLLVLRADFAVKRADWAAALDGWTAVRSRAPTRLDAIIWSIAALRQLDRWDEADALATEATLDRPDDIDLASSYAAVAVARQDWPEAVQRLRRVLTIAPANAGAAIGLAGALQRLQRVPEAEQAIQDALVHHPDNEVLLVEHARIPARAKHWRDAAARWKLVQQRCPPKAANYLEYIVALEQSSQAELADEVASEAAGFAPLDLPVRMKHANTAALRRDFDESVRRWEILVRQFPHDGAVADGLAAAKDAVKAERKLAKKDERAPAYVRKGGSLVLPPKPLGPPRMPQMGPTALDILLTGAPVGPMAIPPPPPPSGLAALRGKMRRLFGKE